jgi:uncharacterized membrane protein
MSYLLLKYLHILSSTFLFGTGIGSAFYLLLATLQRQPKVVAAVAGYVVIADLLFTATTVIIQPLTGWYLMRIAGFTLDQPWLQWSVWLYALAVACWLPVVGLQVKMRDQARAAAAARLPLPGVYWRYFSAWVALGIPAFFAFLAIFYLMTVKPVLGAG